MNDMIIEAQKNAIKKTLRIKTYRIFPKDTDPCDATLEMIGNFPVFKVIGTEIFIPITNIGHYEIKS